MKIIEITSKLFEADQNDLQANVNDFLITHKAQGQDKIPTQQLLVSLQKMGYSISAESLLSLLQNNPIVTNADEQQINLGDDSMDNGDQEDTEGHVGDLAAKSAQNEIKQIGEI